MKRAVTPAATVFNIVTLRGFVPPGAHENVTPENLGAKLMLEVVEIILWNRFLRQVCDGPPPHAAN
jgi:hypothetical protein